MKIKILIITTFALLISIRFLRPGYYSMQDDMHIFRLQQFSQCIKDGQIPCRLIADGGFGYGYPLFNFYPPFFYILSWLPHQFGFSFINSIKISLLLLNFTGILGIYLLSNKLFRNKNSAILSACLYAFIPYRAIDLYVRGAFAELSAISLLPISIYFYISFIEKCTKKYFLLTTFSILCLFLSHNLITLLSIPIFIFFILWPKFNLKVKNFIPLFLSLLLSSFFVIPALLEKQFTTIETMTQGYFDYKAHFTTLKQLFLDRSWGYGASLWGPVDDMSFQIGLPHWPLMILAIILYIRSKKINKSNTYLILFLTFLSLFSIFMTHNKSTFLWTFLPFLSFFQFPWRFLSIISFSLPLLTSSLIVHIKARLQSLITIFIIILTIFLNINYFKEDIYFPKLTDNDRFTKAEVIRQSGAGLKDYWPNFGQEFPNSFSTNIPTFQNTDTHITNYHKQSNLVYTSVNIQNCSDSITLPLVYFPGWQLYIDNMPSEIIIEPNLGLIQTPELKTGTHKIEARLKSTSVQKLSNILSLTGVFIFILVIII